jgi:hypothetical protein
VRERKPALAALALLLIAAGVLASVYLQMQAGNRIGVIQVTQRVSQGQQITGSDIAEVMVAQDKSIDYVTWSQRGLLGKYTAQADLVPGTLLIGQMLTSAPAAGGNSMTIAVTLKEGQYPPSLAVGDTVSAFFVGPAQGSSSGSGGSAASAGTAGGDVTQLLTSSVKILALPSDSSGSSSANVFEVSVAKTDAATLLSTSAEGYLVFTTGAGS